MSFLKYDNDDETTNRICTCRSCGTDFRFGTQEDNEEYCLRCEAIDANNAAFECGEDEYL